MSKTKIIKQKTKNIQLESVLNEIDSRIISKREKEKILSEMSCAIGDICAENKNVYSAFTVGSLTRGDFILGTSDFDLFIVFQEEKDEADFIKKIEKECKNKFSGYFDGTCHADWSYDILYEFLPKIPTVFNQNPPDKTTRGQLRYRAFDTVQCGKVLYGKDFIKDIIVEDPKKIAKARVKDLLKKYQSNDDDMWKIMHIGDIVKAVQIYFGKNTYDKREVLKGFVQFVPNFETKNFIFEFFGEYLDNRFFEKKDKKSFMGKAELFLSQLIKTIERRAYT